MITDIEYTAKANKVFDRPSREEKIKHFLMLLKDPEVQPFFRNYIENIIATSELNILKRISQLESKLCLNDMDFEDEDHEMSIPEQITLLADRVDSITEPVIQAPIQESVIKHKSTLVHKATELVEHLKDVAPRNGEVFLNSRAIIHFLQHGTSEEYRMKNIQNPRQAKKDVIEKAQKMFPDCIFISKAKHGKKEVRIIYKPYALHPYIHTIQNKQA